MFERVYLGKEAIAYLRWSLSQSRRTLSSYLQALPYDTGHVFTFAPLGMEHSRLNEFRVGVLHEGGAFESLAAHALTYLTRNVQGYLVFEDVFVEVGDTWLSNPEITYFAYGSEVYHFLDAKGITEEKVLQTIDNAKGYVTNGILTDGQSLPMLHSGASLDSAQLNAITEATEYVFVEAYDGEGFVVWSRT